MFLLCQHGEGNRAYEADLAALFQQTIHATLDRKSVEAPCAVCTHPGCTIAPFGSTAFCAEHYPCAFKKINKSTEKTCSKFGVFGTCYCDEHYPDIRKRRNLRELQKDIFDTQLKRAGINKKNTYINIFNAAYERFGALYSNEILLPALSNLFRSDPNSLSSNALDLSGLSRCIAFSEDEWKSNSNSTDFRSVFHAGLHPPAHRMMTLSLVQYRTFPNSKMFTVF
jgi:hypothetical protein